MIRLALLTATLAAVCCSPPRGPARGHAAAAPAIEKGPAMIDTLRELAALLARDPLTTEDLIQRLGPVAADHGPGGSLELRSGDARLARVQVLRDMNTGAPFMVDLELAPSAHVPVSELSRAFGPFRDAIPSALEAAPQVVWRRVALDSAFTATIKARLARAAGSSDLGGPEQGTIVGLQLVRERRLD